LHPSLAHRSPSPGCREVFGVIDPKAELPPEEWLYEDLKGTRGHSDWPHSGMAEMLLLIAERGKDARLMGMPSPQAYADEVVRGLPSLNEDRRVLASLRDQYPRLMEAAPNPFLKSLEGLLEARPDDVRRLFVEGGMLGSAALHTGLLWGLETLAWSPEYLPRVALLLARLARLDSGGRFAIGPSTACATSKSLQRRALQGQAATERDRAVMADQHIGHILAHAAADPDDQTWPHRAVRNAIERLAAEHIDRGLMVERYNLRGVSQKAIDEGGDQERALARQYRDWAARARSRWPRMARVLEAIAQGWEAEARREDARAEQRRLALS
jgi:hypothetical protein